MKRSFIRRRYLRLIGISAAVAVSSALSPQPGHAAVTHGYHVFAGDSDLWFVPDGVQSVTAYVWTAGGGGGGGG
ncbi:hypothetical protein ACSNOK_32270, partial [Streptomyces sp. URMC 126]